MSAPLPSAEVAADFQDSLQDLHMNNRWEISNLTIIAKENTEHAQSISRVLENHIRTTQPTRKLPALYVLDSIVKNVGTPYTVYLGRNLFSTFMDAYTLVDGPTRKAMEGMLKTWKEPVPGSIDTRPVFSPDVTRAIENALIKARTVAIQHQQSQARSQRQSLSGAPLRGSPGIPWRETPTPPQNLARMPSQHAAPGYSSHSAGNSMAIDARVPQLTMQQLSSLFPPVAAPLAPTPLSALIQDAGAPNELQQLNFDVDNLIASATAEFATTPHDMGKQQRLKALLDLQNILKSQQLPGEAIKLIRDQVAQLSGPLHHTSTPNPVQQLSSGFQPTQPTSSPFQAAMPAHLAQQNSLASVVQQLFPPQIRSPPPQQLPPPSSTPPVLDQNLLAQLLMSTATTQQQRLESLQPTLPIRPPTGSIQTPPPQARHAAPPVTDTGSLLESLRAAGLITQGAPMTNAPSAGLASLPLNVSNSAVKPPSPIRTASIGVKQERRIYGVRLEAASLKLPRPHLLPTLYEAKANQCSNCARRFLFTDEGKQMKARHLDWHFRVNQRLADAGRRGQNRSWYVDEREWINYREQDEANPITSTNGSSTDAVAGSAGRRKEPKEQYIPVPTDATLANVNCPICQEKFEAVWHDEAQEWVWMDAVRVGGRIYHATCLAEMSKDRPGMGRATPEAILGKRKAEVDNTDAVRAKQKVDSA